MNEKRKKHIPLRTCAGCGKTGTKTGLIRLVRTPSKVEVDPGGKKNGRGVYLHKNRKCWEKGLKFAITKSLKTELSAENIIELRAFSETLPVDSEIES